MAGRLVDEIVQLIVGTSRKPLSEADAKAAARAAKTLAAPATVSSMRKGGTINIPKIPATSVTKGVLDPIGYAGVKTRRPIESYGPRAVQSNTPLTPEKPLSLVDLVGSYITPTYWDRMDAGKTLLGVGDVDLQRGYELPGGIGFMRGPAAQADSAVTASAPHVIATYAKLAEQAAKEGRDLNLVPLTMPPSALDFQGTTSRVAADLLQQSEPKKSVVKAFDSAVRVDVPTFPGLLSPDLDQFLASASPDARKAFIRLLDSKEATDLGLNTDAAGAARYAITDPSQRLAQPAHGGYGIARLNAGDAAIINNPQVPHSDFSTQMAGEYRGRLALPVHEGELFPDAYAQYSTQLDKRGMPLTQANKSYALSRQAPMQLVTQKMADRYELAVQDARARGLIP